MTDLREAIARAICGELDAQAYTWRNLPASWDLTVPYLAQGEVDLGKVADAVLAILPDAEALAEATKAVLDATNEHDVWCSLSPVRNCNCDLNPAKEEARAALANYREGTGREG